MPPKDGQRGLCQPSAIAATGPSIGRFPSCCYQFERRHGHAFPRGPHVPNGSSFRIDGKARFKRVFWSKIEIYPYLKSNSRSTSCIKYMSLYPYSDLCLSHVDPSCTDKYNFLHFLLLLLKYIKAHRYFTELNFFLFRL